MNTLTFQPDDVKDKVQGSPEFIAVVSETVLAQRHVAVSAAAEAWSSVCHCCHDAILLSWVAAHS